MTSTLPGLVSLPRLVARSVIKERLPVIFPEGSPFRGWLIRDISAGAIFAMIYVGAVEGLERFLGPAHIYRMSDDQVDMGTDEARLEYHRDGWKRGYVGRGKAWYADNTREPIRDETIRQALVGVGAVVLKGGVPTTSNVPRYALAKDFAALFDEDLVGDALQDAAAAWRVRHLGPEELARVELLRAGAARDGEAVDVSFPNGEGRLLSMGESSVIAKAVIEEFARRFLTKPAVLWLSDSGRKVVVRDDVLARRVGLKIDAARNLPDVILADLAPGMLLVFVEIVSTDGPVTEARRRDLLALAEGAKIKSQHVAFVTAFMDREHKALKKCLANLAWNSFVWLASEPDAIVAFVGAKGVDGRRLHDLLSLTSR